MVRKSLAVNPNLKGDLSTREVLSDLRAQAKAEAAEATARSESRPAKGAPLGEGPRSTVRFFLTQKAKEVAAQVEELSQREAALAVEREELKDRTLRDLAEFVNLIPGLSDSAEGRDELRSCRNLFATLNIDAAEVLEVAKKRKR